MIKRSFLQRPLVAAKRTFDGLAISAKRAKTDLAAVIRALFVKGEQRKKDIGHAGPEEAPHQCPSYDNLCSVRVATCLRFHPPDDRGRRPIAR